MLRIRLSIVLPIYRVFGSSAPAHSAHICPSNSGVGFIFSDPFISLNGLCNSVDTHLLDLFIHIIKNIAATGVGVENESNIHIFSRQF